MHRYRNKTIILFLFLLVLFGIIAFFSFIQFQRGIAIFNLNMPYYLEDLAVLGLSILSMLKVVYEIYKIEHSDEYEERIKV